VGKKGLLAAHLVDASVSADWFDDILPAFPSQQRFILSRRAFTFFCGAIGVGKTNALVDKSIKLTMQMGPYPHGLFGRTGRD